MKQAIHPFIFYSFSLLISVCYSQQRGSFHFDYPKISKKPTTETYHGIEIIDEYANLKKLEDHEVQNWFKAQDSLAESYFARNSFMNQYLKRFKKYQDHAQSTISMVRISENGNYFYLKYDNSLKYEKLYYREKLSDDEIELFDPSEYINKDLSITYLNPSFDGKKIAVGFNGNGDFASTVILYNLETKEVLKDVITNINPDFGGIEWLPDSSGFIYLYFPEIDYSQPGYKKNSFSVIHKLGENPADRKPIFQASENIKISEDFYPKVKIGSSLDQYIIGYVASSDDYYDGYIAKLSNVFKGKPEWKPFFRKEDRVFYDQGEVRGEEFIFRQGNDEGNLLARVSIKNPDFDDPDIFTEGSSDNPIVQFGVTKDKIYFIRSLYGAKVSLYVITKLNEIKQLNPPFEPGYASFFGESVKDNNIAVGMDGWTSDYTRFLIYEDGIFSEEALYTQTVHPEFENIISKEIMVTSHDGIEVPLSLVYKRGLDKNSKNEVFIYVYGAYGESMNPFFSPIFLDWAAQGGILAFPHVRGGGEKGKKWHEQGMKNLKFNSWKDLIACTEALIDLNYTSDGLISLYTTSAGGITAGMAVNERPDLFSSFIAEVPRLNPLGLESSNTSSSTSYLEYGRVQDSTEFSGLLKMDPYLNIRSDITYPAILVMPSYNDDRIPLWDSGKYIAKLQNNYQIYNSVIMDIDYQNGHESSGDYDESVRLYSKIFSFAKSNMKD